MLSFIPALLYISWLFLLSILVSCWFSSGFDLVTCTLQARKRFLLHQLLCPSFLLIELLSTSERDISTFVVINRREQPRVTRENSKAPVGEAGWLCRGPSVSHPTEGGSESLCYTHTLIWWCLSHRWPSCFQGRLKLVGRSSGSVCHWVCFQRRKRSEWLLPPRVHRLSPPLKHPQKPRNKSCVPQAFAAPQR